MWIGVEPTTESKNILQSYLYLCFYLINRLIANYIYLIGVPVFKGAKNSTVFFAFESAFLTVSFKLAKKSSDWWRL